MSLCHRHPDSLRFVTCSLYRFNQASDSPQGIPCKFLSIDLPNNRDLVHYRHTVLEHYLFHSHSKGDMLLALGLGSLFNHSSNPNLDYRVDSTRLVPDLTLVGLEHMQLNCVVGNLLSTSLHRSSVTAASTAPDMCESRSSEAVYLPNQGCVHRSYASTQRAQSSQVCCNGFSSQALPVQLFSSRYETTFVGMHALWFLVSCLSSDPRSELPMIEALRHSMLTRQVLCDQHF